MKRYEKEACMLKYLAVRQLNLEKNVRKPKFEGMKLYDILTKLDEEIQELHKEFKYFDETNHNFNAIRHEIGDCAAVLSGLVAWINKKQDELQDDGA
jgi:hypothetical protein